MKTLPTKTYQVWAMESGDTVTGTVMPLTTHALVRAQNKNGIQQGGSTVGVALRSSCISITIFFLVKGTAPANKKLICAEMTINIQPILSYACLLKKMMEKSGF